MNGESRHSSVGKAYEIDQRAIKIFLDWLPDNWLPRKQDPDFFIDFLVEIVANGEPTGRHFAAQVKGYEDVTNGEKPLSYAFQTKHLKYYLNRSQHPVFLFLINVTAREGYWLFAQRHLKEKVDAKILDAQDSLTIHFPAEDNFSNSIKFKCLLPETETFVRDLHPGSIKAAIQKRRVELESMDPRCSVSISTVEGKEQIVITPRESFPFKAKIRSQNVEGWRDFYERGKRIKLQPGEIEFEGVPILEKALSVFGGGAEIQYGNEILGSLHVISKVGNGKVIPIDGHFRAGTTYLNFHGLLPNSPLEISFETSFEAARKGECFNLSIGFSLSKWVGQTILGLAYFDHISSFANAFSGESNPEIELFVQGNSAVKGELSDTNGDVMRNMVKAVDWFRKCRWLAQHYKVNPFLPPLDKFGWERMEALEEVYDLLTKREMTVPSPHIKMPFIIEKALSQDTIANSDRIFRIEKAELDIDFFGVPVRLGPTRHLFTEMNFVSQSPTEGGMVKVILTGTEKTVRISSLI